MISRYNRTAILDSGYQFGTNYAAEAIRKAVKAGQIKTTTITAKAGDRLDTIAAQRLGDGRLWWIIASASNIGWGLQIPPGTVIVIPRLEDVAAIVG